MSVYPMNVFVSERTYERASHRAKTASTNDVKNKYEKTDETKSMHKFSEFFSSIPMIVCSSNQLKYLTNS